MYDRAMQALYALALEPIAETTADTKSFGFRKGRSCQDACEYIFFTALSRKASPQWILEGDIKGCFDNISHDWLLENIPMDKSILKQFLKAGFVFKGELFPTEDGTPQGGIISPILANMALDGLQQVLSDRFHTNRLGKVDLRFKNSHKVNLVRYADDFIVTAATQEIALEAKELIREFLLGRGLELSEEKTLVTHINDGFDLLGWNFRKYKGKLIVKPSKNSIQTVIGKFSETILKRGKAWEQEVLIMKLNQQIRDEDGQTTTNPFVLVKPSPIWTISYTNYCGDGRNVVIQRKVSGGFRPSIGIEKAIEVGYSLQTIKNSFELTILLSSDTQRSEKTLILTWIQTILLNEPLIMV